MENVKIDKNALMRSGDYSDDWSVTHYGLLWLVNHFTFVFTAQCLLCHVCSISRKYTLHAGNNCMLQLVGKYFYTLWNIISTMSETSIHCWRLEWTNMLLPAFMGELNICSFFTVHFKILLLVSRFSRWIILHHSNTGSCVGFCWSSIQEIVGISWSIQCPD